MNKAQMLKDTLEHAILIIDRKLYIQSLNILYAYQKDILSVLGDTKGLPGVVVDNANHQLRFLNSAIDGFERGLCTTILDAALKRERNVRDQ